MAYQAIETKFLGPTNHGSARIRVKCQARTMFVSWDHLLGVEGNHDAAAMTLAEKLDWRGRWFAGGNAEGSGNVYVNVVNDNDPSFIVGSVSHAMRADSCLHGSLDDGRSLRRTD